jgi:hypothetical protein
MAHLGLSKTNFQLSFKDHNLNLDLLRFQDRLIIKRKGEKTYIKDVIRKRFLVMLPEEWVRQLIIHYLVEEVKIPVLKIQVEKKILINGLQRRFDILIYDEDIVPFMIIECKAPQVPITQQVFDQVAAYNQTIKAPYIIITNGISSYTCFTDDKKPGYTFIDKIPRI